MVTIGVDLERVERFAFVLTPGGQAFYERVYTPTEQTALGKDLCRLALHFTGKEAVSKALGTGLSLGLTGHVACREIEILDNDFQEPEVVLTGRVRAIAQQLGLSQVIVCWGHMHGVVFALAGAASNGEEADDLRLWLRASLRMLRARLGTVLVRRRFREA